MVSTRVILAAAVLALAVFVAVIQAQENCQRASRNYLVYRYTWSRYYYRITSTRVTEYYCRYQKTPSNLPDGALRLGSKYISSSGYVRGRVEIWRSSSWGTICNRGWSSSDGTVACQQMGYAGMDYRGIISSISGGSGSVHAQYLYCSSSYEWITQCFSSWGSTCSHSRDVGVNCENKLRLQLREGSNALVGRGYYWRSGSLRKICDDYFSSNDARVMCRQLGFGSLIRYYVDSSSYATQRAFGYRYSTSYWISELQCDGTELFLHHCRHSGWSTTCYSGYEDVGVQCNLPTPDVTVTVQSSSSVRVAVEMMEALRYSASITGYKIRFSPFGTGTIYTYSLSSSTHTYSRDFTGLDPYTRYTIQATVVISGVTTEAWSTTQYAITHEDISQPVQNLVLSVRSATSIYVSWTAPESANGLISAYIVEYESITPGIDHHVTASVSSNTLYTTLNGLQEHTTYSVAVRVRNGAGESPNVKDTAKTLEAVPSGPPTGVQARTTGPSVMSVFWEPPQLIQQNGEITGYSVRYRVIEGSYVYADPTNTSYHMEGLTAYTTYLISVAAKTAIGTGVYSTEIRQTTAESEPTGSPLNVQITALTSEHLLVTYSPPAIDQQNGVILSYTVEFGDNLVTTTDVEVPTSSGLFYRISEATPYTDYHARVAASTSVGRGPFSDWVAATTLVAAPTSPPRDVSVLAHDITSTSFRVTWSPPVDGTNGPIVAYTVVHGLGTSGFGVGTVEVMGQEYTIMSLRPFTNFFVSVAAKTTAGEGPFSPHYPVKTLPDVPGAPVDGVMLEPDPSMANIAVTWSPLSTEFYNDVELTGYIIYYVSSDPDAPSGMEKVGPTVSSFTLTELHQRVAYTVKIAAENAQGIGTNSSEKTAITSGLVPDDAPFDLRAWLLDSSSIHLEWTARQNPEGNLDILGYVVAYGEAGLSTRNEVNVSVTDLSYAYDITGLKPWTEYIMTVYSINEVGRSPGSTPYTTRTASAASPIAPTIISSSIYATSTSVTLVWTQISDDDARGVVIGYNVRYGLRDETPQILSVAGHVGTHVFNGLTPASTYQFAIAVHNANGSGPYSDVVNVITPDDIPTIPRQLRAKALSPTSIELTWLPPVTSNGAYVYLLNFTSLHEEIPDSDEIQLNSSLTEYVVHDLEEHVEYDFNLQAKTSAGIGEHAVVSEMTLEAPPSSPPLNVAAVAVNATAIHVSWESPPIIHHNSPLTGYAIIYSDLSSPGGDEVEVTIQDPDVFTTVLSNLEPYSLYDIQVAAMNEAGDGPRSPEVTVETPKTRPPQPTILDVSSPLSTQLNVTWTLPDNPNGVLLGYNLRFEASYPPDIDSSGETLPGPDATYLLLVDLHPGTSYNIYLLARNDFGMSDWEQSSGYTLSKVPSAPVSIAVEPISSMSMEVSWTPTNTTDWNGPLKEIILIYGEAEDNSTEQEKVIPIDDMVEPDDLNSKMEINSLTPFTEYYFMMVLVNDAGEGPYSEEIRAVTLQDVPGPVENLTVTVQNTNITLIWDPPLVHNGILLQYTVYLDGDKYDTVTDDFSMVIPNLEEQTQYVVGVTASTSAGEGDTTSVQVLTADLYRFMPTVSTPYHEPQSAGAPAFTYYTLGAVCAVVILAIFVVLLLGVTAYKRRKAVKAKRAKGYAEDDWNLYDDYEDSTVFEGKEGFQVQENQLEHRPQRTAAGRERTDKTHREAQAKGSNISSALAGLRSINAKDTEAFEEDLSAFDNALDRLRGMGDPFVVHDDERPILY